MTLQVRILLINELRSSDEDSGPVWRGIPSVKELVNVLYGDQRFGNHVDKVWPGLFLGDVKASDAGFSLR